MERLVAGGDGLARFEGIPIFVPRSAPGDRARVRLVERRPDYGRAEIVELLAPGPGRREPPCPYFRRCGGCDLQHMEDELQTRWKAQAVVETLERLARHSGAAAARGRHRRGLVLPAAHPAPQRAARRPPRLRLPRPPQPRAGRSRSVSDPGAGARAGAAAAAGRWSPPTARAGSTSRWAATAR